MTSKDPAEDKLIASIQKTKAQATGQSDKQATASVKAAARKPAAKKAAAKKTPAKAAASGKKTSRSAQSNKTQLVDMFQHGRRVWPD